MDTITRGISKRLARPSSRGAFLSLLGKAAVAGAAVAAGGIGALELTGGEALAAPLCCSGTGCSGASTCPGTSQPDYANVTYCCYGGHYYSCTNSLSVPNNDYVCTLAAFAANNCPSAPAHR